MKEKKRKAALLIHGALACVRTSDRESQMETKGNALPGRIACGDVDKKERKKVEEEQTLFDLKCSASHEL
jgi:hypothetical protein